MKIKQYLIPSEENDYKPWIITPSALGLFCLVIWSIRIFLPAGIIFAAPGIDPTDLMNRINSERTQRFISALQTNDKLITAATAKASDMLSRSYFAHVDPDGNYVWPRIEAAGYKPYLTLGENLAMDFNSAESVVNAWMNSPTHRANIVNEKFEDQGLASQSGLYEPGHDSIIVVSLFGTLYTTKPSTPSSPPPATKPAPAPAPKSNPSPKPKTTPAPAPPVTPTAPPAPTPEITQEAKIEIYKDIKINITSLSGHTMVNVDVVINGSPTLVTARLKTQSITMIAGKTTGQYLGSFTFDPNEDLSNQTLTIEARDKANAKTTLDFPVNLTSQTAAAQTTPATIPVSNEAQVIFILRIIFGIFATLYMGFLVVDAIIIHRLKIKRPGIHSWPHFLVFLLVATVSLFGGWF